MAADREPDSNGSWDPLAAVMAAEQEAAEAASAADETQPPADAPEEPFVPEPPPPENVPAGTSGAPFTFGDVEDLQFIRLSDKATLPTRAHDSDAGLDIYAADSARISPGARVSVGTGLAVAIPEGLAGLILPRSGLALKNGVTLVNAPGLIDPGFRGEVRIVLLNTDRNSDFKVASGDRIAQLILVPIALASPLESDSLDSTGRGEGGFGSTG